MHISVMKNEVINLLNIKRGGLYFDCTFGEGGHSRAILKLGGVVIAIDRDASTKIYAEEIKAEFPNSFFWVHSSFSNISEIWAEFAFPMKPDGILFDLGFSSNQIEDNSRGFSFLYDSNLDMRYDIDNSEILTGLEVINRESESSLGKIFTEFGEERLGYKMAKKICESRKKKPIASCFDLISILSSFNTYSNKHFATKIFQALRIYVNDEFFHIKKGVQSAVDLIKFYGRVVVISFHSLEDKIIKNIFFNKNLMLPSKNEIILNPRARSAKVRWIINNKESLC